MTLKTLFLTHVEWLGVRRTLKGQEQRKFERWVARAHPEIAAEFRGQPALFRQQCREVARGGALPARRGLGFKTIKHHASAIAAYWSALPEEGREPFSRFIERLLATRQSKRELQRFLAQRPGPISTTPVP